MNFRYAFKILAELMNFSVAVLLSLVICSQSPGTALCYVHTLQKPSAKLVTKAKIVIYSQIITTGSYKHSLVLFLDPSLKVL